MSYNWVVEVISTSVYVAELGIGVSVLVSGLRNWQRTECI